MNGVRIGKRDFSGPLRAAGVRMAAERLEWRAVGGPWSARVRVESESLARLWDLAELLRCELVINDNEQSNSGSTALRRMRGLRPAGDSPEPGQASGPAWWGYVSGVSIHAGAEVVRISLDEMATRVAVRYRPEMPGGEVGEMQFSAWAEDEESRRVYGDKEKVIFLPTARASEAAAYAAAAVKQIGKPVLKAGVAGQSSGSSTALGQTQSVGPYAILEGRGWWDTTGWRYYREARGKLENLHEGAEQNLGASAGNRELAFSITVSPGWKVSELWLRMKRAVGTGDTVRLEVRANAAGNYPSGTVLGACSLAASAFKHTLSWVQFKLDQTVTLGGGGVYWVVLARTGGISGSYFYTLGLDEGQNGNQTFRMWDGATWNARPVDADATVQALGVEDAVEQIRRMLVADTGGQFKPDGGTQLTVKSGKEMALYRAGSKTARAEIETLLAYGRAEGRLLARTTPGRLIEIYGMPEPEAAARAVIGPDGRLAHVSGRELALSEQPAGEWTRLGALSPAGRLMGRDSAVFLEKVVWSAANGLRAG